MAARISIRPWLRAALLCVPLVLGCGDDSGDPDDADDHDDEGDGKRDAASAADAAGSRDAGSKPARGAAKFSAIYDEIIVGTGCNGGPLCHGGAVGKLRMANPEESYDALVGVRAMGTNLADEPTANCEDTDLVRVVPNDPDASLLIQKLDPPDGVVPCGSAMPPTGPLEAEQIEQIRRWIENGAPND